MLVTDAPAAGISADAPQPCGALVVRRIGGLTAIGQPTGVLAAQALHEGRGASLAAAAIYRRPTPACRPTASPTAGSRRTASAACSRPTAASLGAVGALLDRPGCTGAAARARRPAATGRASPCGASPAGPAGAPAFTATLQRRAPADALAYVGVRRPGQRAASG